MNTNSVFVYGTLMKGYSNHEKYLANYVVSRSQGLMAGELYHLNYGYPAAIDGSGVVKGEIFGLSDIEQAFTGLDYLEDFNQPDSENLYERQIREVQDSDGNIILCYVYLWATGRIQDLIQNGVHVNHGDWKEYVRKHKQTLEEDS